MIVARRLHRRRVDVDVRLRGSADARQLGRLQGSADGGAVELGYAVAPGWRERGVAGAAVAAMLREAWAAPEVDAVLAETPAEPSASVRVLEKAGFRRDGAFLEAEAGRVWRWRCAWAAGAVAADPDNVAR